MLIRRGQSGGLLDLTSFPDTIEREEVRNISLRVASVYPNYREAAKMGLQSLYADTEDVLEKYKDFDIVKAMHDRKSAKLLWVRARAIDADVVNANGDYFSKEELLKEVEIPQKDEDGKVTRIKVPAYKTFEGVPIYCNHKNDDIELARGMVVYAEWCEDENCVYCTFFVDEEAYPDVAHGIRVGFQHDVSMGCFPAGTLLLTDSGWRNIENITTEDKLIDDLGNFVNIQNKQIKLYKDNLIKLNIEGGISISTTIEHPVLIFSKDVWNNRKKRIRPIVNGKITTDWEFKNIVPEYVEAKDLKIGDIVLSSINGEIQHTDLNINRARLLGYFLAEGSYIKQNGQLIETEFNFALDEENTLAEEVINLIKIEFNLNTKKYIRKNRNICNLRINSKELSNWFYKNCKEYSNRKKLENSLLFIDIELQKHILGTWLAGDGCLRKQSLSCALSGTTTSKQLALQLHTLFNRCGIPHITASCINGKRISFSEGLLLNEKMIGDNGKKTSYTIDIGSKYGKDLLPYIGFVGNFSNQLKNKTYKHYICKPIKSIESVPFDGLVFNFETDTNNYQVMSMIVHNCSVVDGICSECGNIAQTESAYCDHMKKYKGKTNPRTGKKVYEKNRGLKFIELSIVGDGAFDTCEIEEIYDTDEILEKASTLSKKAQGIMSSIRIAETGHPHEVEERQAYEALLRQSASTTATILRLAQTAGTLVGGQLLAGEGADQNTTVSNILQFLGIDVRAGLNILDMLNLALNFLEVAVMNLFARKNNVDLSHVGKITKSMADLQSTMQDLIDDGVDTSGSKGKQINQPQAPQAPQPQQNAAAAAAPDYAPPTEGSPGKMLGPTPAAPAPPQGQTQNQSMPMLPGMSPTTMFADTHVPKIIWAATGEEMGRTVTASINQEIVVTKPPVLKLAEALQSFALDLGLTAQDTDLSKSTHKALSAVNNKYLKNSSKEELGEQKMNIAPLKNFADNRQRKVAAQVSTDLRVEDEYGNKIILSSNGDLQAFHKGKQLNWEPTINDTQYDMLKNSDEGIKVAATLLADFGKEVRASMRDGRVTLAEWKENHDTNTVLEEQLEKKRTGTDDKVKEKLLGGPEAGDYARTGYDNKPRETTLEGDQFYSHRRPSEDLSKEVLLGEHAGLYKRDFTDDKIREVLLEEARKGFADEIIEEQLADVREHYGPGEPNLVTSGVLNAIANTVVSARVTPEEVVEVAQNLFVNKVDLPELIQLAHLGAKTRKTIASRTAFHKITQDENVNLGYELLSKLSEEINPKVFAADLSDVLIVVASESSDTIKAVTRLARIKMGDSPELEPSSVRRKVSKSDLIRSAIKMQAEASANVSPEKTHFKSVLHAMARSAEELSAHPREIIDAVIDLGDNLSSEVELARTASVLESRLIQRARNDFYGNKRQASKKDITENVIGWLADYAENYNLNTTVVVAAAQKIIDQPNATEQLLTKTLRQAEVKVTDEKTVTRRIECTLEDLGGIDPKSEDFDKQLRDKAIEIMSNSGYQVDPATFALTDVNVQDQTVTASVSTHITKTFGIDGISNIGSNSSFDNNMPNSSTDLVPTEMPEDDNQILQTASVKKLNKAKRLAALKVYAQAPQAGGVGIPGGGNQGLDMTSGGLNGAANELGMSALTVPTAANGEPDTDPNADTDDMPEPGTPAQWGTVCPRCGSKLSSVNGEGHCDNCNADVKFTFNAEVTDAGSGNDEGTDASAMPEEAAPAGPELGGDMGLGAATAPQPSAPMGATPPTGPTANKNNQFIKLASKPIIGVLTWEEDPDVYIRLAASEAGGKRFNRHAEVVLPVGYICPSCGNKDATTTKDGTSFCTPCGSIHKTSIKLSKNNPNKLLVSIKTLI